MAIAIDSVTGDLLAKALDVSMQMHRVIANNVANVNTEGYQPLKVDFAGLMEAVASQVKSHSSEESLREAIRDIDVSQHVYVDPSQDKVQLERQMAEMAQNTLRYQALVDADKSLDSIMKMAIEGGKV